MELNRVPKTKPMTIYQMRRVVNPKGIWRPGNSAKPFHVKMMVQEGENNPNFTHLKSDAPWLAVIKKERIGLISCRRMESRRRIPMERFRESEICMMRITMGEKWISRLNPRALLPRHVEDS